MLTLLRVSIGVAVGLMLWTATAHGQGRPASDQQVTVRQSDGTVHEFQASPEAVQGFKVGDRIEGNLREAPKCP